MTRELYWDCMYGIAGDMALASLIDAGADLNYIEGELSRLPIERFQMKTVTVLKRGITAKLLQLEVEEAGELTPMHAQADGRANAQEQVYRHVHAHGHTHEHGHEHTHTHEHEHGHTHEHEHGHTHEHEHTHTHENYENEHTHTHEHEHTHAHEHTHTYKHHHVHVHDHSSHTDGAGSAHSAFTSGPTHFHRKASTILDFIRNSELPARVKARSTRVFEAIAAAEGKIHGLPPEDVHFHEVGAMDSILDIIGVCLALESLDIERISASPVPTGYGRVRMAHGLYPIPAPATAELLRHIPLARLEVEGELTTPTGAGLLAALVERFGGLPEGTLVCIGYGAGNKDFAHPNVVRSLVFQQEQKGQQKERDGQKENGIHNLPPAERSFMQPEVRQEQIVVLEAQMDDLTGEMFGYVMERLFEAGALDAFYSSVYMKKNRPGVLVTVLALQEQAEACQAVLLRETSTLGVRWSERLRSIVDRKIVQVETPYGKVRIKQALSGGHVLHQAPEYEDAAAAARQTGVPLQIVYESALQALVENPYKPPYNR